ncbi:MAG: hypothetical protein NC111_06495 [Bacteroides sp.]|nr:hypothetical protein [Bacteroides sp.]MCM1413103.1 hypothetical protein [Bacteroides sp.]MCM1472155.1 hypothetical protein [Bacteroides sp.]
MRFRLRAFSLIMLTTATIHVAAEQPDTLNVAPAKGPIPSYLLPVPFDSISPSAVDIPSSAAYPHLPVGNPYSLGANILTAPPISLSYLVPRNILGWEGGSISGSSYSNSFPGMMSTYSASMSLTQNFGPLALSAHAGATDYGYFRGMQRGWSFGGSMTYEINPKWSVTLFGEYHTPIHPLTPAMAGYMGATNFGGYASYNISEHWGVSMGVRTTRSLLTNRWETRPIVTPYFKFSKNVSIGIDVGGIIYEVAKDYIDSRNGRGPFTPAPTNLRPPTPTRPTFSPR